MTFRDLERQRWEYCTIRYVWVGRGYTQEIAIIYYDGQELKEWQGKAWSVFLNYMGEDGWEMVTAKEGYSPGGTATQLNEGILFFKRRL